MAQALATYFCPTMRPDPPPEIFLTSDWFPQILKRIEAFESGFKAQFGQPVLYDWYRIFDEQEKLFKGGSSKAAVSVHCFAAGVDQGIPEEFQGEHTLDFFAKVIRLDKDVRLGWLDYQKPNGKFTFFHVDWGFMIPFTVIRQYIDTYIAEPRATEIFHNINSYWHKGARW